MTDVLYKWMIEDLVSPVQNTEWPVEPGEWAPKVRAELCESGYHGVLEKDVLTHLPRTVRTCTLWVVEARGVEHGDDKFVSTQMRLVEKVGVTNDSNLRLFAADCAEDVLENYLAVFPNDTSLAACIDVVRRFAAGSATESELRAAAYAAEAARDAARSAESAAESAAGDAAYAAARSGAWSAARDAARDAAYAAGSARSAARSAARAKYSNWLVVRIESGY
jgi:hypothetical protein